MKNHINIDQNKTIHIPNWTYIASIAAILLGFVIFFITLQQSPAVAWRLLLVNFLFWVGLAQGAFMWSVAFRIARASWSAPINRLAHAFVWSLPVMLVTYFLFIFGKDHLFRWDTATNLGDRTAWFNSSFLALRDSAGLLLLIGASFFFAYTYLRAESKIRSGNITESDIAQTNRRLSISAVVLAVLYLLVFTLLAFDLIMSLMPRWYSTLFGWYFVLGSLYTGIAALIVTANASRRWLGVEEVLGPKRFLDMGNFLMGLAMAMTYFFFAQSMVIWYENLPPEISYLIPRYNSAPWRGLMFVLLAICYIGPFALLVIREMKENRPTVTAIAVLVLIAMWLERFFLVVPSLVIDPATFPWGEVLIGFGIGLGFLGISALSVALFLARYPAQSPLDLALAEERKAWA